MAPIWLKVNLMIIMKSLPRRYLWTDFNNFFTDLFMRETSFIKKAIYGGHIGFTMSVCPSICASFPFWRHQPKHFNFSHQKKVVWKLLFGIDVAKCCMVRNIWLRLMFNLNLRVTLKKLNIITGHEKSIKNRLESILFWHGRTIFCHSVLKYSWFLKIQWSNIQMLLTKTSLRSVK